MDRGSTVVSQRDCGPQLVVVHTNQGLSHQVEWAQCFKEGFAQHGIDALITPSRTAEGDVQVVLGPHYAYREWLGKNNVLYLDRCLYGPTEHWCTLGWLRPDGSRDFMNGRKDLRRWSQHCQQLGMRLEQPALVRRTKALIMGDYDEDEVAFQRVMIQCREHHYEPELRRHPLRVGRRHVHGDPDTTLEAALEDVGLVIGWRSTALILPVLKGIPVICLDGRNPVAGAARDSFTAPMPHREKWAAEAAWTQWHSDELRSGEFWRHLGEKS